MRAVLIRNKDAKEFEDELNTYLYRDCRGGYERGVNVEVSYCSCCQPSRESVDITESDFEELLNNTK